MKILLDECVPVQIRDALPEHEIHSATDPQWRGLSNGELLHLAEQQGFKLIIVADKNMRYQQNLSGRNIAILELWTDQPPADPRAAFPIYQHCSGTTAAGPIS
jgi:hypothetical protein